MRRLGVPCRPLSEELTRLGLPPPAALLIDAEGFDCGIVADLECHIAPQLLQYEDTHCSPAGREVALRSMRTRRACGQGAKRELRYSGPHRPRWNDVLFFREKEPFGILELGASEIARADH